MEEAVRALLSSRGVRLEPPSEAIEIPEFRLLGIAEKVPEIGVSIESVVFVWHVESGLVPISDADFERWCVDAPAGRNWILCERELPKGFHNNLPSGVELVAWSPETLSRWIGDAVISGELVASTPSANKVVDSEAHAGNEEEDDDDTIIVPAIVDIESWLIQSGREGSLTSPVLLKARLWDVEGSLIGPEGDKIPSNWKLIEDPWSSSLALSESILENSNVIIRMVEPPASKWLSEESLSDKLPSILDRKIQGGSEESEGPVRSIMLEWWRADANSLSMSKRVVGIPGWIIDTQGREGVILHSGNGRTYPIPD
tara:strand:+ start:9493 stop:10434 length:942 start_codon:yes stop_codon:yes gene_type:complete